MTEKKHKYLMIVALVVFCGLAFGRVAFNGFVNLDDNMYVTENPYIQAGIHTETLSWALTTTYFSYWHPLTWLSYMLDYSVFGANASGYHVINLLLHIGAALFLFFFLHKTTKSLWPSFFAVALFALHPLRVESVAWVSERKDVLSLFFGMASLYAYAFYAERPQISKYAICFLLFVLSLMSKPMLITLPLVMLLVDYWPLGRWQKALSPPQNDARVIAAGSFEKKGGKKEKSVVPKKKIHPPPSPRQAVIRLLAEKAPFFALSAILSVALIFQQKAAHGMVSLDTVSVPMRLANALISYAAYLGKTFCPMNLAVFYPYPPSFPVWQILVSVLVLATISMAAIYWGKRMPFLPVGWLWYLGTLFPVIGLMQAGAQAMADRYTYLPSIGLSLLLVWGAWHLWPREKIRKTVLLPGALGVCVLLAALTWKQCGYWKDSRSLFDHALQSTTNNYLAHTSLGVALDAQGEKAQAVRHYQEALRINPHFAQARYNLANVFREQGKMDEALKNFQEVLQINPRFPDAHNNIGILLEMHFKKPDEAIAHYRQELLINNNAGTHFNLGAALAGQGKVQEAQSHFASALALDPGYEQARRALTLMENTQRRKQ